VGHLLCVTQCDTVYMIHIVSSSVMFMDGVLRASKLRLGSMLAMVVFIVLDSCLLVYLSGLSVMSLWLLCMRYTLLLVYLSRVSVVGLLTGCEAIAARM